MTITQGIERQGVANAVGPTSIVDSFLVIAVVYIVKR